MGIGGGSNWHGMLGSVKPLLSNCACLCVPRSTVLLHQFPAATVPAAIRGLLPASNLGPVQSIPTLPVSSEQQRPAVILSVPAGGTVVSAARAVLPRPDHFKSWRLFPRPAPAARLPLRAEPAPVHPSNPTSLFLKPSHPTSLPFKPCSITGLPLGTR